MQEEDNKTRQKKLRFYQKYKIPIIIAFIVSVLLLTTAVVLILSNKSNSTKSKSSNSPVDQTNNSSLLQSKDYSPDQVLLVQSIISDLNKSNLDQILIDSTREFESRELKERLTGYTIHYLYGTQTNMWSFTMTNGGYKRPAGQKTVTIPPIPCDYCSIGKDIFTQNKKIDSEARKRNLRILISDSGTILIIPKDCIQFWFDFESKFLVGKTPEEKKNNLLSLQKEMLSLAVIIYQEVADKLQWDKNIYDFNVNVGNNLVPHVHLRITLRVFD